MSYGDGCAVVSEPTNPAQNGPGTDIEPSVAPGHRRRSKKVGPVGSTPGSEIAAGLRSAEGSLDGGHIVPAEHEPAVGRGVEQVDAHRRVCHAAEHLGR